MAPSLVRDNDDSVAGPPVPDRAQPQRDLGPAAARSGSPLGEPERATGQWLPWLRLGTVLALTGAGCGALAVGAVGGHLAIGSPALLRDLAGRTETDPCSR